MVCVRLALNERKRLTFLLIISLMQEWVYHKGVPSIDEILSLTVKFHDEYLSFKRTCAFIKIFL